MCKMIINTTVIVYFISVSNESADIYYIAIPEF